MWGGKGRRMEWAEERRGTGEEHKDEKEEGRVVVSEETGDRIKGKANGKQSANTEE